jgi:hypothetical protein
MPSIEELNGRLITVENSSGGGGGGGSTVVVGTISVTVPTASFEYEGSAAAVGVTAGMKVSMQLAPPDNYAENDPTMLAVVGIYASAGAGTITVGLVFSELTKGPINLTFIAS